MKCPVCSHVYPDTLSRCSRCGRVAPERAPGVETSSTLIEFPSQRPARASLPDWRIELNEKVRAIKARRSMEAMVGEATAARRASTHAPDPEPTHEALEETSQQLREEHANPIVAAALDRLRRASANAAPQPTPIGRRGSAAAARVASLPSPQPSTHAHPMQQTSALTAVEPARNALVTTVPVREELFDPAELLEGLEDEFFDPNAIVAQAALPPAPAVERASIAARALAGLIDVGVYVLVSVPFVATTWAINGDFRRTPVLLLLGATLSLLAAFYLLAMFSIGGRTIGMMVGGLRVVDEEGNDPTPRALFLRATGYVAAALPAGLGFAWVFANRDRCGLHDLLSGTRVVRE